MGEPNCQECDSVLHPHWVDAEIVSYSCPACEAVADAECAVVQAAKARAVALSFLARCSADVALDAAVARLLAAESARKVGR